MSEMVLRQWYDAEKFLVIVESRCSDCDYNDRRTYTPSEMYYMDGLPRLVELRDFRRQFEKHKEPSHD